MRVLVVMVIICSSILVEYPSSIFRWVLAASPINMSSCLLLPSAKNRARRKAHMMSQGETKTLIANAPAMALTTNPDEMTRMSTIMMFFSQNE